MALFHFTVKALSRKKGQSAVASCAYRRAEKLYDERLAKIHDYRKKPHVVFSEILIPENPPKWLQEISRLDNVAEQLWNTVEAGEKRVDAQVAREIEFSLPIELNQEQAIHLAREFIHDQLVLRGMVADWSVHWEPNNPHVHVMLTLRELTATGFGAKNRDWNSKALLNTWREQWAEYANFHLRLHQHEVRIDHRSYQDQGIDLLPTVHRGRAVTEMHQRGISTDIMQESNKVNRENLKRIATTPKIVLKKIATQSEIFSQKHIAEALSLYTQNIDKSKKFTSQQVIEVLEKITHHESVFTERDIAKSITPYIDDAELFTQALWQVKNSPELLPLGRGEDGRDRFTTREMFKLENEIQRVADRLRKATHHRCVRVKSILSEHKLLTEEQRQAILHITQPKAIACLVGRAGTGKSYSLGAAKEIWEAQGLRVQGVALSGIAADGLAKDIGIPSRTIHSFLSALHYGRLQLHEKDVVVMDEAGMADIRGMHGVLKTVRQAGAKLVLVGDPQQLQPVGPGASFRALLERVGFAEIQTVYRQQHDWQRRATHDLAGGKISKAIDAYQERQCIHTHATAAQTMQQLVSDWITQQKQPAADMKQSLILAHRNDDVMILNQAIRQARIKQSEIAEGYSVKTVRGAISIAQDDRLLFLKNDRTLGVCNGRLATIQAVKFTEAGNVTEITVRLDGKPNTISFSPMDYKDFTYGYAATVHKAQGVTVDKTFIYAGGKFWNRHLTYVAMTRHRQDCHLYVDQETYPDLKQLKRSLGRAATKDSVLDFPLAFAKRRGIDVSTMAQKIGRHLAARLSSISQNLKARWQALQPVVNNQQPVNSQEQKYQAMIQEYYQLQEKCQQTKGRWGHVHQQNQLEKLVAKISRDRSMMCYLKQQRPEFEKKIQQQIARSLQQELNVN
jgi:ATP-dependent exoDNAse (exonuclease V) alpha subunit